MKKIDPKVCFVIPPPMMERLAEETGHEAQLDAQNTLAQMRRIKGRSSKSSATLRPSAKKVVAFRKKRRVHDAQEKLDLPGPLVMTERRKPGSDVTVREAFDSAGAVLDFFKEVFRRDSLDGAGVRMISSVRYGKRFLNAFWNGEQVVFGDGDGRWFHRFTAAIEVAGHEWTHALVQETAGLEYFGEPGALNEHICDAIGIMIRHFVFRTLAIRSSWLIGDGLLAKMFNGAAIRSMAEPGTAYDDPLLGKDPQVAHMRNYVVTDEDNGGVHINSGILNRAFYLAAIEIGGYTWVILGPIWYLSLERLGPKAGFLEFAQATVDVAGELHGEGSDVQRALIKAWKKVGLPTLVVNDKRRQQRKEAA